jgi:hypothetical protein
VQHEATDEQRQQHAWCLQLRQGAGAQAFAFYLSHLRQKQTIAHRNVCATSCDSREFEAGRLSAFTDAVEFVEKKYVELAKLVEVVPE